LSSPRNLLRHKSPLILQNSDIKKWEGQTFVVAPRLPFATKLACRAPPHFKL